MTSKLTIAKKKQVVKIVQPFTHNIKLEGETVKTGISIWLQQIQHEVSVSQMTNVLQIPLSFDSVDLQSVNLQQESSQCVIPKRKTSCEDWCVLVFCDPCVFQILHTCPLP